MLSKISSLNASFFPVSDFVTFFILSLRKKDDRSHPSFVVQNFRYEYTLFKSKSQRIRFILLPFQPAQRAQGGVEGKTDVKRKERKINSVRLSRTKAVLCSSIAKQHQKGNKGNNEKKPAFFHMPQILCLFLYSQSYHQRKKKQKKSQKGNELR